MAQTKVQPTLIETTEELRSALSLLKKREQALKTSMAERRTKINKLNLEQAADEMVHREVGRNIATTTNRLFVRAPLAVELVAARYAHIAKLRLSQSDKITVAKAKILREEIESDLHALQKLCTHRFVFSYDGYGGSRSCDWDDQCHGHRVCAHCYLRETSRGTKENLYTILAEDGTRLALRDLRSQEELPRGSFAQEWFSIEFLEKLFESSAHSININWPVSIDKKSVLVV